NNRQPSERLGLSGLMPRRPAARMQPRLAEDFDAVGQQRIVGVLATAAAETLPRRRVHGVAVQPFHDTTVEGADLGLRTRQPTVELGDSRAFVEERVPVLGRPTINTRP